MCLHTWGCASSWTRFCGPQSLKETFQLQSFSSTYGTFQISRKFPSPSPCFLTVSKGIKENFTITASNDRKITISAKVCRKISWQRQPITFEFPPAVSLFLLANLWAVSGGSELRARTTHAFQFSVSSLLTLCPRGGLTFPLSNGRFPFANCRIWNEISFSVFPRFVDTICSHFQKKRFVRSQVCRTSPNKSALESTKYDASNGGSNFEIQPLGTDLVSFEVARLPQNWINKNLSRKFLTIWWPDDFKRDDIGPKWLDLDDWPIVGDAKVVTFQRTSN